MKSSHLQNLIFIYNADSGLKNALIDGAHKILSPSTYECKLCEITFGAFTENTIWKKFRIESDVKMDFLHKNEFRKQYASKFGYKFTFPIVLAESVNGLEILITTEEMNGLQDAGELIRLIKDRATD